MRPEEALNLLAKTILRRVVGRVDTAADLAGLPTVYRKAGAGLMSRIAAAGILRLALRWPALTLILVLSVVAARIWRAGGTNRTTAPRLCGLRERT